MWAPLHLAACGRSVDPPRPMNKRHLIALACALALPCLAEAQASVQLRLDLPVVLPQLVVVSPGVQVVPDVEEEVFFVDSWYWVRHDGGWYRARSPRGGWVYMQPRYVPARLVQVPPGKYKRYHPGKGHGAPARYEGGGHEGGHGGDHGHPGKGGKGHGKH